ncbi:hypothetical protein PB01_07925 [Psychrobacillus glaciei]|uniref:Uncharacterized protein n=1 Tax=Psychrobacillus glaciei TaxID=2283160 RepID=A0A5J6SMU3_9BACI|nr:hypothetical protein PB01_07925 [Psychrobacillus glaciei]
MFDLLIEIIKVKGKHKMKCYLANLKIMSKREKSKRKNMWRVDPDRFCDEFESNIVWNSRTK